MNEKQVFRKKQHCSSCGGTFFKKAVKSSYVSEGKVEEVEEFSDIDENESERILCNFCKEAIFAGSKDSVNIDSRKGDI